MKYPENQNYMARAPKAEGKPVFGPISGTIVKNMKQLDKYKGYRFTKCPTEGK